MFRPAVFRGCFEVLASQLRFRVSLQRNGSKGIPDVTDRFPGDGELLAGVVSRTGLCRAMHWAAEPIRHYWRGTVAGPELLPRAWPSAWLTLRVVSIISLEPGGGCCSCWKWPLIGSIRCTLFPVHRPLHCPAPSRHAFSAVHS